MGNMHPQTTVHKHLPRSPSPVRTLLRLASPLYRRQSSQEFSLIKDLLRSGADQKLGLWS